MKPNKQNGLETQSVDSNQSSQVDSTCDTSTNLETSFNRMEERMRTAPLSEKTRDYLIVIGTFNDAMNRLWEIVAVDYDYDIDDIIRPAQTQFSLLQDELYKLLAKNIRQNMCSLNYDKI